MTAPATGDRLNGVRNDLGLLYRKVATNRVVVKGPHGGRLDDIESSEVAAGGTSITSGHELTIRANSANHSSSWRPRPWRGCTS